MREQLLRGARKESRGCPGKDIWSGVGGTVTNGQKVQVSSVLSWEGAWHALVASMAGAGIQNVASLRLVNQGPDRPGPWDAGENSFLFRAMRSRE